MAHSPAAVSFLFFFFDWIDCPYDPAFSAGEFAVVFSCGVFTSLGKILDGFFEGVDGFHGCIRAHVFSAYGADGRVDEGGVHAGFAVRASDEVCAEFLLVLLLGVGSEAFLLFLQPSFEGNHLRGWFDADLVLDGVGGRYGFQVFFRLALRVEDFFLEGESFEDAVGFSFREAFLDHGGFHGVLDLG